MPGISYNSNNHDSNTGYCHGLLLCVMRSGVWIKIKANICRIRFRWFFNGYGCRLGYCYCTCLCKGYSVEYLSGDVRLIDICDPQKENGNTFHYALVPKGRKPSGIPENYTVIETPVKHVMCMTSLQLSNFIRLDACDYVVGITSTRHLFNKEMNERLKSGKTAKIGIEGNFDNEVIMSMNPDVIFISPFKRGGYDAMREIGIPLVPHWAIKK